MNNDYPCMLYGKGGATRVVQSEEDEKDVGGDWSRTPSQEHHQVPAVSTPTPQPSGQDALIEAITANIIAKLAALGVVKVPNPPALVAKEPSPTVGINAPEAPAAEPVVSAHSKLTPKT